MGIFSSLISGSGAWNPLAWLLAFVVAVIIVYLIWSRGERSYKKGTEQTTPFLSGNKEPSKDAVHIRACNLYWGYTEALKGYYERIVPLHSGDMNDYVLWYLGTTALILVIVVVLS
jgi:hypothetical protein